MPHELRQKLEREARRRGINLNVLVTQILTKFVHFDRPAEHIGAVVLSRPLLRELLTLATPEELQELAQRHGPRIVKPAFLFFHVKPDLPNLLTYYFEAMGAHSGWFRFTHRVEDTTHELILQHSYGPKWTAFLQHYMRAMLKSALGVEPVIEAEQGTVTIQLRGNGSVHH